MNNDFPRMIYQAGGNEEIHGGRFATLIVHDAEELDAALAGGWHLTTTEARDAAATPKPELVGKPVESTELDTLAFNANDSAPPTRAELEQKAHELGVEFSPRLGDAKLAERIEDKLKEKA
jgi:hypothetical protein